MIMNVSARTRRCLIGVAVVISLLVIGVHHSIHPGAPAHGGLAGCAALSSRNQVTAGDYPRIRAEFASSRWPDLRTAGTAYIDLAVQLHKARGGTDGYPAVWLYQAVWSYQRLSAACAQHGQALSATSSQPARRTASAHHQGAGPFRAW
jgi:hypothetical protein